MDYSRRAADYDRVRADETTDREFWLRGFIDVGGLRDREHILDVGAGTGRFAKLLCETNPVVALGDYAAALREIARVAHRVVVATSDMATRRLGILEEAFPSLLAIDRDRFPSIPAILDALKAAGFRGAVVDKRAYARRLTTEEQLDRVRHRYLSTFDLLPPDEYERGLRFLEAEMPRRYRDGFEITAQFTFVGATK